MDYLVPPFFSMNLLCLQEQAIPPSCHTKEHASSRLCGCNLERLCNQRLSSPFAGMVATKQRIYSLLLSKPTEKYFCLGSDIGQNKGHLNET